MLGYFYQWTEQRNNNMLSSRFKVPYSLLILASRIRFFSTFSSFLTYHTTALLYRSPLSILYINHIIFLLLSTGLMIFSSPVRRCLQTWRRCCEMILSANSSCSLPIRYILIAHIPLLFPHLNTLSPFVRMPDLLLCLPL